MGSFLLMSAAASSTTGDSTAGVVVQIAQPGDAVPTTTVPSAAKAIDESYDAQALKAAEVNAVTDDGVPVPLALPPVPIEKIETEGRLDEPTLPFFQTPAASGAQSFVNNYQSDHAVMNPRPIPNSAYNVDYWYWLGMPTNSDPINCDNSPNCFWFVADQVNTSGFNVGMHFGPQHGESSFGDSNGLWKISVSGYNNGVQTGSLSSVAPPEATWVRIRVWRLSVGGGNTTWGVWALWAGSGCPSNDCYAGSISLPGLTLTHAWLFTEVMETNGPCVTDFERAYFNDPVYRNLNGGPFGFSSATANYENNCADTTWQSIQGDYVKDERITPRIVPQNGILWQIV
jgi:hypothetical protein